MKQRLWQVLLGFIIFYHLINLVQDMPNLVNGNHYFDYIPDSPRAFVYKASYLLLLSAYPLTAYLILLQWYPKSILAASGFIIAASAVLFFAGYFADQSAVRLRFYFRNNIFYAIIYVVYGVVFFLIQYSQYKESQARELLLSQRQSELAFLRSQINPHFLFNSLNNIYSLVYEGSPKSLEAIAGFSELMRYMLYDSAENIALISEIEYLRKYIALQELRYPEKPNIQFSVTGEAYPRMIAPLILIPFVENAFKHGRFSEPGDQLTVTINNSPDNFYFYCHNRISQAKKDEGGGVGLNNVRKRLDLIYPSKHELKIINDQETFTVKLHLQNT